MCRLPARLARRAAQGQALSSNRETIRNRSAAQQQPGTPCDRPGRTGAAGGGSGNPSQRDASCPTSVMQARPCDRAMQMMRSSCQVPPMRPSTTVLAVAVLALLAFPCVHADWQAKGAHWRLCQPRCGAAWLCRCHARSCRPQLPTACSVCAPPMRRGGHHDGASVVGGHHPCQVAGGWSQGSPPA